MQTIQDLKDKCSNYKSIGIDSKLKGDCQDLIKNVCVGNDIGKCYNVLSSDVRSNVLNNDLFPLMENYCLNRDNSLVDNVCVNWCKETSFRSDTCKNVQQAVCTYTNDGKKLFDSELCDGFCKENNDCKVARAKFCNENINNPEYTKLCVNWCVSKEGQTNCDAGMKSYCNKPENRYVDKCSCLNFPINTTDNFIKNLNPLCVDKSCHTSGYYTTELIDSGTHCQIINCNPKLDLNDNTAKNIELRYSLKLNCGTSDLGLDKMIDDSKAIKPNAQTTKSNTSSIVTIIIVIVGVLIILGILVFIFS